MKTSNSPRAFRAALIAVALGGASTAALADIKDYTFELVDQSVQAGPDKIITVRLMNTKTGKPVPDAVIFATRLDMAPDGMQEMATKVTPVPGAEPGTYKFKATFGMAGRWQFSLGAKVQGETGSVENKLVITAQK
ncbi:FixH family protein [Tardiphaga sp. 42S5]|uniref:FixH family protein n=1 Tax=Tardiphaga sp. 42S5 TaxID=1404799 RepID=UPI002A59F0EF|nr:FixH family protein [Tardiphaga sp. 42S5]WPO40123.1 FixH family protein [Tardiphaga sp. 42S5]